MKISEKTFELNFCTDMARRLQRRILWFGLTQKQEAQLGFDAGTKLGGRAFLFQFKISNWLRDGTRRFSAPHKQMLNLIRLCGGAQRSVYYVLPDFGTTSEIGKLDSVLDRTWFLDVASIPTPVPVPTKRDGMPRQDGRHFIDIHPTQNPATAVIHSEPIRVKISAFEGSVSASLLFEDHGGMSQSVLIELLNSHDGLFLIKREALLAIVLP